MPIVSLSLKSLLNRRVTAALTVFAIAVSVTLLLGVEKVRIEAKASFASTISGTDLIVGARSGAIQLLLYSVFRIGNATNNISWKSYREIAARPEVAWTIPFSLGDSHRGFRVLGTNGDYFRHYRFGRKQPLAFAAGGPFADLFDTVLGADVAQSLGYKIGDPIVVDHGLGREGFSKHEDKPFRVAGILAKTGTPVDRTVHVSLEGIEAIHLDWQSGSRVPGMNVSADEVRKMALRPKAITAFLIGLESRLAAFALQRHVNEYRAEPLLAILPGVALQELWSLMGTAESALTAISALVVVTGLLGMLTTLLAGLNERRREMAILRSVGARPRHVFALFVSEATILTTVGTLLGLALLYGSLLIARPIIDTRFGLYLSIAPPTARDLTIVALVVVAGFLAGAVPAYQAYRKSLADGMMVRT
ncbi:MAG: ABC transporter permease [Kiloniellales bacterium]|nr:ABC transporter permease [Kiloniellales bacterium]MDJ0971376.1 ABC transporter permease [Kiloniellales bacterium]MDJ0980191.1 ABC transporter permease [Kiloniellales bacterium]